ncbi:MAG: nucleoside-diphosphate kinase [bacterium]|nr:nucleoside-diphosphate kinase [Candidatus Jorgensenbacteria bacterium]
MKHQKEERTFVLIKPDGIQRSLIGEIIHRLERTGLKFVAFKFLVPTREQCIAHYNKDDVWCEKVGARTIVEKQAKGMPVEKSALEYGRDILEGNVRFLTSGPVLAISLEGNQAVGIVKKLVGGTEPLTSDVGTIRADLTIDSYAIANVDGRCVRNLVHCSDETSEAERETKLWFKEEEIIKYHHINEVVLYDVDLGHILGE